MNKEITQYEKEIMDAVNPLVLGNLKLDSPITHIKQLPFVVYKRNERNYWNVNPIEDYDTPGNFMADCNRGTQYACSYLNNLLHSYGVALTWITEKMVELRGDRYNGIAVGFLSTIQEYAKLGAQFIKVTHPDLAFANKANKQLIKVFKENQTESR